MQLQLAVIYGYVRNREAAAADQLLDGPWFRVAGRSVTVAVGVPDRRC